MHGKKMWETNKKNLKIVGNKNLNFVGNKKKKLFFLKTKANSGGSNRR
jgi:hypothetical protein